MHGQNRWRQMVLVTQAVGAVGSTIGRRAVVQVLLIVACLALLAPGTAQQVGAEDVSAAGTANALTCEAAGGEADVVQSQTANGAEFVSVQCNGGYLDGWDCYHSTASGTWNCFTAIIVPVDETKAPTGGLGLEPTTNGGEQASPAPIADSSTRSDAQSRVVAPDDDQHQDRATSKKGKGKKGGKHRKR